MADEDENEDRWIAAISAQTWTELARTRLRSDSADVTGVRWRVLSQSAGVGTQVYRVSGTAATRRQQSVDWGLVIKIFTRSSLEFQASSDLPTEWSYWRREWLTYASDWLPRLSGPVRAPDLYGLGEVTEADDEACWVAIEDLGDLPHVWSTPQFARAARAAGEFNGAFSSTAARPTDGWLAEHWLEGWTEEAGAYLEHVEPATQHPVARQVLSDRVVRHLTALWDHRNLVWAALDELPVTLAHQDVFARNVSIAGGTGATGGDDGLVALDWAYVGPAPIGQELTSLVGASQLFLACPPEDWEEIERCCLAAYVDGLRRSGAEIAPAEVRRGYLHSVPMRFVLGALPPLLYTTTSPDAPAGVPVVFGCSYEDYIANVMAFLQFQCERIEELRADLGF